jgi:anti-sigma factor ChrR (cupin superfamily)
MTARAVVRVPSLRWVPRGPLDEKLLEDDGGRRRTMIVRLAPRARLSTGGEGCLDILVVAGELRDERHVHPAGAYLHAPAGIELSSLEGCTLFLKQRPARRRSRHAMDSRMVVFEPSHTPGLWQAPLHDDLDGRVVLLRFDPGTQIAHHHHDGGEEFFVLSGEVRDELGTYATDCWVRQPPDSAHSITSPGGCLFLAFAHHL